MNILLKMPERESPFFLFPHVQTCIYIRSFRTYRATLHGHCWTATKVLHTAKTCWWWWTTGATLLWDVRENDFWLAFPNNRNTRRWYPANGYPALVVIGFMPDKGPWIHDNTLIDHTSITTTVIRTGDNFLSINYDFTRMPIKRLYGNRFLSTLMGESYWTNQLRFPYLVLAL